MSTRHLWALSCHVFLSIVMVGLLTLVIPVSVVKADSLVTFPDPKLRGAIRAAINKPTGDIYQSDLDGLTALDAGGLGIVNLTGLQYCTSLTVLYLGNNQISDVSPLAGLTSLTSLRLYENQISDISPLAGLTSLTLLRLYSNQISDVSPLASLTSLTSLSLYTNQISDISPLAGLINLTKLYLGNNQISDISPVSGLIGLTTLGLGYNQTDNLTPLTGLTGLAFLALNDNQIGDISPLVGLTSLAYLYLDDNQIGDISPLSVLTNLTHLELSDNEITDVSALAGLTNLTILHLDGNQIGDVESLVDNPGIASGGTVYLNTNPLSSTSVDAYVPALEARGVEVYWDVPDSLPPNRPGNVSPGDGAVAVSPTPILQSSGFSDPDAGDTHAASWWQVRPTSGDYSGSVFDSYADNTSLTSIAIPPGTFDYSTTYYWHVRHKNSHGAWSPWSAETSFTTVPTNPLVTTCDVSGPTTTSARLNGSLTSMGAQDNVTVSFEWGTVTGVYTGTTDNQTLCVTGAFSDDLTGITPGTTYYFRAKAVGNVDTNVFYGAEKFFTTLTTQPSVTTNVATLVTTTSARMNGTLTSLGSADNVTVWFVGSTAAGGPYDLPVGSRVLSDTGDFHFDATVLTPGTTYYYMAVADGDGDPVSGNEVSCTTSTTAPTVTTSAASSLATTSATLNGNLGFLGTATNVTVSFQWGTTASYGSETSAQSVSAIGTFIANLTSLAPNATYHFRATAVGHGPAVYGEDMNFTTASVDETAALVESVMNASDITVSGATVTWTTNEAATSQVEYGLTEEYGSISPLDAGLVNSHSVELTGLKAAKTYHYRVMSTDAAGNQAVSADYTFTTDARSGGLPAWAWVLIGFGAVAIVGAVGYFAFSRRAKHQ